MQAKESGFSRWALPGGAALLLAGLLYSQWIVPAQRRAAESGQGIDELRKRVGEAAAFIGETAKLEQAAAGDGALKASREAIPKEPTEVWLPAKVRASLGRLGIVDAPVRLNSVTSEPALPDYERSFWNVTVPRSDGVMTINEVLNAVAELEEKESVVRILDLSFISGTAEPYRPAGSFNFTALIPK